MLWSFARISSRKANAASGLSVHVPPRPRYRFVSVCFSKILAPLISSHSIVDSRSRGNSRCDETHPVEKNYRLPRDRRAIYAEGQYSRGSTFYNTIFGASSFGDARSIDAAGVTRTSGPRPTPSAEPPYRQRLPLYAPGGRGCSSSAIMQGEEIQIIFGIRCCVAQTGEFRPQAMAEQVMPLAA